jgi:transcriptional regulator with XRE-family HTH domain
MLAGMPKPLPPEKKLGIAIRARRKSLGISQEHMAFLAVLDRSYCGSVERGERNVSLHNVCAIAAALNISVGELCSQAGI